MKIAFVSGETERLLVPASAIAQRGEVTGVYVLANNALELRMVNLGSRTADNRYPILAGLQAGEQLVADPIAAESGAPVVLLGGAGRTYDGTDETALAARIESLMRTPAVNLAGKLGLAGLTALLRRCRLFIGNNSGPAHLASAVAGIPCLLVWAPRNEWAWRPVGSRVELVFDTVECSDDCRLNQCDRMQYCLDKISLDMVFARYMNCFAARGAGALCGGIE